MNGFDLLCVRKYEFSPDYISKFSSRDLFIVLLEYKEELEGQNSVIWINGVLIQKGNTTKKERRELEARYGYDKIKKEDRKKAFLNETSKYLSNIRQFID